MPAAVLAAAAFSDDVAQYDARTSTQLSKPLEVTRTQYRMYVVYSCLESLALLDGIRITAADRVLARRINDGFDVRSRPVAVCVCC
jgi:hypothetical protein